MEHKKFKNKSNGQIEKFWVCSLDKKELHAFKDISCTKEIDLESYELVTDDTSQFRTPFEIFGVECGKGWYPLIQPIEDYMNEYNSQKEEGEKLEFLQIKEKCGSLTIYTNYSTPELDELIENAGKESSNVCEFCGSKNHLGVTRGYIMIMCEDCVKKYVISENFSVLWYNFDEKKCYQINIDDKRNINFIEKEENENSN